MTKSYVLQGMTLIYKRPSEAATRGVQKNKVLVEILLIHMKTPVEESLFK